MEGSCCGAGFVIDETLTPSKISPTTFSLKGSWDVDGSVYAQVNSSTLTNGYSNQHTMWALMQFRT